MCIVFNCYTYFSCVIDRTGKVYWLKNNMNHWDIVDICIEDYKPLDIDSMVTKIEKSLTYLEKLEKNFDNRDYFYVKIIPKDIKKVTRNREDWEFDFWEMLIPPIWYRENREQYEESCWQCWEESIKVNLAIDHEIVEVKDIFLMATGNAIVEAHGNSIVEVWDNATVKAYDNVKVKAYDNAKVEANDNSKVEANYGRVRVDAYDNATVSASSHEDVTAHDNSKVKAHLHATVRAEENARVEAYDNVSVESHDNSIVKVYNHATVNAWGGMIEAYDCAAVWRCWHEAKIIIKSKFAVVIDTDLVKGDDDQFHTTGKIIVSKDAIVERQ